MTMISIPRGLSRAANATLLTLLCFACGAPSPDATRTPMPTASGTPTPDAMGTPVPTALHGGSPRPSSSASPEPTGVPRIGLPVEPGSTVEGHVDVDGHDIYARCAGDGSPTILYFTGWAPDPSKRGVDIAKGIERALGPTFRVCSYERRNTGRSATVEGTQSPEDVVADIDGLLAKLGERGPFLLLGASFGGLVASAYAVAHPEQVAGVLLLDASTAVDYDIDERHDFQGMCLQANRDADAWRSLEKLDNCGLAKWIHDRREREPAVPLIYLAAQNASDRGDADDDHIRKAWVESWTPGTWRVVNAPHWMDESHTALVADAVREVLDLSQR